MWKIIKSYDLKQFLCILYSLAEEQCERGFRRGSATKTQQFFRQEWLHLDGTA